MSVVIDIGCKGYRDEDSIGYLIDRYHPEVLYGFDAHHELKEGEEVIGSTRVVTARRAAWTKSGVIAWTQDGTRSRIDPEGSARVAAFSLARFLADFSYVEALKIDAEGAEYELIPDLLHRGCDARIGTLLIEWHGEPIETAGRWNVEPWTL